MKNTVHVDFGPWEVVEFHDRGDVGQLPRNAACSCGVEYRKHHDDRGRWVCCSLAFKPQNVVAASTRIHEKTATVPQWGGVGGQ